MESLLWRCRVSSEFAPFSTRYTRGIRSRGTIYLQTYVCTVHYVYLLVQYSSLKEFPCGSYQEVVGKSIVLVFGPWALLYSPTKPPAMVLKSHHDTLYLSAAIWRGIWDWMITSEDSRDHTSILESNFIQYRPRQIPKTQTMVSEHSM